MNTIQLPNGCRVGAPTYAVAWALLLKAEPESGVDGFDYGTVTAAAVLREMRHGLHDRINRHTPNHGKGRKWDPDWQRATRHAARELNTPRLRIHWLPAWLKGRFAHRLARNEDL